MNDTGEVMAEVYGAMVHLESVPVVSGPDIKEADARIELLSEVAGLCICEVVCERFDLLEGHCIVGPRDRECGQTSPIFEVGHPAGHVHWCRIGVEDGAYVGAGIWAFC